MRLPQIVVIALVAAIGNPFCCCLNLFAAQPSLAATATADSDHACCMASVAQQKPAPVAGEHASDSCPHQQEKDSQINQAVDSGDASVKPNLFVAELLPPLNVAETEYANETRVSYALDASNAPPAVPLTQAYCVFLI